MTPAAPAVPRPGLPLPGVPLPGVPLPGVPLADRPLRLDIPAEDVGKGLGRLVVAVLEIVRQLLERQALRRMDAQSLTDEEIERLGRALADMETRLGELRETFEDSGAGIGFRNATLGTRSASSRWAPPPCGTPAPAARAAHQEGDR